MQIIILGNGGAINSGLPYNAFLLNGSLLCELPPDIMRSLGDQNINPLAIDTIFVSHFHGDHIFGAPFFLLNSFMEREKQVRFIGPAGIKEHIVAITRAAFGQSNPCLEWLETNGIFEEISHNSLIEIYPGVRFRFFRLNHSVETYGFEYIKNDKARFVYIADTLWCDSIAEILRHKPRHVLLDMNGEPDDPEQKHLSETDVRQKALSITGTNTKYYGTHLKKNKKSTINQLEYVKAGFKIRI
ncbi:MAG: ribonuclease Z [Calditrichaceae bacterium]|nr:ribonuclease Z [Calditrichaceae bacterium]MBN2707410.1 ribonuclease Z [Calditrichaceae bacterium]